jgi:hypothetical protein
MSPVAASGQGLHMAMGGAGAAAAAGSAADCSVDPHGEPGAEAAADSVDPHQESDAQEELQVHFLDAPTFAAQSPSVTAILSVTEELCSSADGRRDGAASVGAPPALQRFEEERAASDVPGGHEDLAAAAEAGASPHYVRVGLTVGKK